jgi:fibronectin type 3 domain-containing protein
VITYTPLSGPGAPSDLVTTSVTNGVNLSWIAPGSDGLETYGIWRANSPFTATSSAMLIASIATTSTSYSDTSVVHGTVYYYRVTATSDTATSSLSNQRASGSNSGRIIRLKGGVRMLGGVRLR